MTHMVLLGTVVLTSDAVFVVFRVPVKEGTRALVDTWVQTAFVRDAVARGHRMENACSGRIALKTLIIF